MFLEIKSIKTFAQKKRKESLFNIMDKSQQRVKFKVKKIRQGVNL